MPVLLDEVILGFVSGPAGSANAFALLLTRLAARESEGRSLASEVLHLYREVHLIEQLSNSSPPSEFLCREPVCSRTSTTDDPRQSRLYPGDGKDWRLPL